MTNQENIKTILQYMPQSQAQCFIEGFMGAEQTHFTGIADKISNVIKQAPAIYETDGLGEEVKPVLHYFYGNVDIYVTEIDKSKYNQHFGYTSIGHGSLDAGYIDLDYIFNEIPLINLDFNFTPKTIAEYKKTHDK